MLNCKKWRTQPAIEDKRPLDDVFFRAGYQHLFCNVHPFTTDGKVVNLLVQCRSVEIQLILWKALCSNGSGSVNNNSTPVRVWYHLTFRSKKPNTVRRKEILSRVQSSILFHIHNPRMNYRCRVFQIPTISRFR